MRELQPVNQNVILDVSEEVSEQKTAGGIIIPDTAAVEKPKFAKVVALSNIEGPEIAVGDVVFYKEYSGTEIDLDDTTFFGHGADHLVTHVALPTGREVPGRGMRGDDRDRGVGGAGCPDQRGRPGRAREPDPPGAGHLGQEPGGDRDRARR